MPKFLLEVEHESTESACIKAVETFLRTGSHFLTKADWGCLDGEHKAWIIVDVDSRRDALNIVPSTFRTQARAIQLNTFTMQDIDDLERSHQG